MLWRQCKRYLIFENDFGTFKCIQKKFYSHCVLEWNLSKTRAGVFFHLTSHSLLLLTPSAFLLILLPSLSPFLPDFQDIIRFAICHELPFFMSSWSVHCFSFLPLLPISGSNKPLSSKDKCLTGLHYRSCQCRSGLQGQPIHELCQWHIPGPSPRPFSSYPSETLSLRVKFSAWSFWGVMSNDFQL